MADLKWKASGRSLPVTVLDTALNSLANNTAVLSAAIDNDADLDLLMDLFLDVTFGTNPTADSPVEVWMVRSIDGTTFEDASATGPIYPKNGYLGSFFVRAVTTQQVMCVGECPVPIRDFKILLVNKSGQAFPASGSTLKAVMYKLQVA